MKNTDMFKILNGVDEKYIKEADLFLNAPEKSEPHKKSATVLRVLFPVAAAVALMSVVLTLTLVLRPPTSDPSGQTPGSVVDPTETSAAEGDDLKYVKYEDHVEITSFTANDDKVEIPAKIEGLPVTSATLKKARRSNPVEHIEVHTDSPQFTTLTLPDGCDCILYAGPNVEYLEPSILRNKKIKRVEVHEYNEVYTAIDGILYSKDLQYLVACPAGTDLKTIGVAGGEPCDSVFPDTLEIVSARAFEDCASLVGVTLPKNLLILDRRAFYGCTSLEEITFCRPIDCAADFLAGCTSLKTVYTDLDAKAFAKIEVELPESATLVTGAEKYRR